MVDYGVKVTRVAGGWIYNYSDKYGVFVPYDNEFSKESESVRELDEGIANVSNRRKLFYNFITWYNAKPKVEKSKEGLVTTGVIDEFLKL